MDRSALCSTAFILVFMSFLVAGTGLADKSLQVMTYNVENLFHPSDETNGLGFVYDKSKEKWVETDQYDKEDFEFTPNTDEKRKICNRFTSSFKRARCLTDWTDKIYKKKIERVADVIVDANERFPDILGLVEIENEQVLQDLVAELEDSANLDEGTLKYVFKDGYDRRGIDTALVYRSKNSFLELALDDQDEPKVKFLRLPAERLDSWQTRYIVEAEFEVFGKYKLFVFVCHWPSQRNNAKATFTIRSRKHKVDIDDELRLVLARMVRRRMDTHFKQNHDAYFVVTGDFNVLDSDSPNAIKLGLLAESDQYKDLLLKVDKSKWTFSTVNKHKVQMEDVHAGFFRNQEILKKTKNKVPRGTYFYPPSMAWTRLDRFFTSKNLEAGRVPECQKGLAVKTDSYKIHNNGPWSGTYTYHEPDDGEHRFALHVPFIGSIVTKTPLKFIPQYPLRKQSRLGYSDHFPISMTLWDKGSGDRNCRPDEYYGVGVED
jgi:endonuclease/exonuclease/phosphatase family metal-dependent hydrolase